MKPGLLFDAALGIEFGSMIVGLAAALAYVRRKQIQEFRYGVFYTVFALIGSIGYCLASIGFFFNFLTRGGSTGIALFCSLVALGLIVGLIVLGLFVKKDDRILFVVLSFYSLFTLWLAPVFLWNLIYLIFIVRRSGSTPPSA